MANLGSYSSWSALHIKYPNGGTEGDTVQVNNVEYTWDKYELRWNKSVSTDSDGNNGNNVDGDLTVGHDLHVGGKIYGDIKQSNRGLYVSLEALQSAIPYPTVGEWAQVGNTIPAEIYVCQTSGVWSDTGQKGGQDEVDLTNYFTKVESDARIINIDSDTDKTVMSKTMSSKLIGMNDFPAYSTSTTYAQNDVVKVDGLLYKCLENISTPESFNSSKWVRISIYDAAVLVSTKQYTVIQGILNTINKPNGFASLDSSGKLTNSQIPLNVLKTEDITIKNISSDGDKSVMSVTMSGKVVGIYTYDEYSSNAFYDAGNIIRRDGLLYLCTTSILTAESFDSSKWKQISVLEAILHEVENSINTAKGEAKSDLDTEVRRALQAEGGIIGNLENEVSRSTSAETELQKKIDSSNSSIQAESNRAIKAEKDLETITDELALNIDNNAKLVSSYNANLLTSHTAYFADLSTALSAISTKTPNPSWLRQGINLDYLTKDGWMSAHYNGGAEWTNTNLWTQNAGNDRASVFNVTNQIPLTVGYYTLDTAIAAVLNAGKESLGLMITFAEAEGFWKTYQYTANSIANNIFSITDNWADFGSLAAGSETHIIIDNTIGAPTVGNYYTLETAVTALIAFQKTSGITYAKPGLIISYKTGENTFETKQFQGVVADFGEVSLWKDFGGGSTKPVIVSDKPIKNGTDALSTGGAYNTTPSDMIVDDTESGTIKIQLVNSDGNAIGNQVAFSVGGGGTSASTIVAMAFENSPLYAAYGSEVKSRVSLRSKSSDGTTNSIAKLELIDRDSSLTVWKTEKTYASVEELTDFSQNIYIDFTSLISTAGTRRFKLVATDDGGYTGTKNINVTTIDATCQCVQTLNYTDTNVITPTTQSASVSLYKFPNNTSEQGISAQIDIKINGTWQSLSKQVVTDTYAHSVTVKAATLGLTHGSYELRIQGTDVASGVKGNIIYTTLMVIDSNSTVPIVSVRYNDLNNGNIKLYETVTIEVAVYNPNSSSGTFIFNRNGVKVTSIIAYRSKTYQVTQQINDASIGSKLSYSATSGTSVSPAIDITINGTAIDATLKEGAIYHFDFATRSNQETDHSIVNGDYSIAVNGSNWSSNGFTSYLNQQCLRIAENVKAELNHAPFSSSSLESNGMAIQFTFATENVMNDDAKLMECYDETLGAGFYVTGKIIALYSKKGTRPLAIRYYDSGEKITVSIVVEPSTIYKERSGTKYCFIKMYINGEESACIDYTPGNGDLGQQKTITFDGTEGDFYLYNIIGWNTYYEWSQAFKNYLVKQTDTTHIITEYDFENVLSSQSAEGTPATMRPNAKMMYDLGMPYIIEAPYNGSDIAALDNTDSTSTKNYITLYYYNPKRPWTSFKATEVQTRNQGTTSAKRPVKNKRYYLSKSKGKNKNTIITLLFPDDTTEEGRRAIALAKINKVQVGDNTIPVDIITVKVDYSDSGNANDCAVCDMMNATYLALGSKYQTPAQRYYDGTYDNGDVHLTGLKMNHSTANHPIATFRCQDETLQNVYFHAKGNWKEDKSEQFALGFKDTPGYNKGCLNYGDFVEFFGFPEETINDVEDRFKVTLGLDTSKIYLLSLYCGSTYRFMRYTNGAWTASTGSMSQVNGKWVITGDVLNPVEGFELLNYQGFDWFQGVDSVDTMMALKSDQSSWVKKLVDGGSISATTFPAWTYYFECMIDNDQLAIDYALGKKVPYNLYRKLRFCDSCDYSKVSGWKSIWKNNLYRYANPYSIMSYYVFTDYKSAVDQQAKNMQPMWFLDEGGSVINGVYNSDDYLRMYLNKIYDCDCVDGDDNDGGNTVDAEVDPQKPSDSSYTNPYAGYGSVLWNNLHEQQIVCIDSAGTELSLKTVAAAMRNCQTTVDGISIKPFSPEGSIHFVVDQRLSKWQKVVSSYDGERKYINYTATSDALYFYALKGLGLISRPSFIRRRWRIRDGYYQTGNFYSNFISGRIAAASGSTIKITAAKTGYFGIGNDASGNLSESCFLEAGSSYTFTNFSHEEGALLYIYQADRMSMIDLSEISISDTANFSIMKLVETLILGSDSHQNLNILTYGKLTQLNLGSMPFLTTLNIKNTVITTIDCSGCPRIAHIIAGGSSLASLTLAKTSPINDIALPNTMSDINFQYLPALTYNGLAYATGLQVNSFPVLQKMRLESSPNLNAIQMIRDIIASQSNNAVLQMIRCVDMTLKNDGSELINLKRLGVQGIDENGNKQTKPVISGTYQMTTIRERSELSELSNYFEGLTIITVIEAYIDLIDTINGESYNSDPKLLDGDASISLENIDKYMQYYNGETYEDYLTTISA